MRKIKLLAIVLTLVMAIGLVTGCAGNKEGADKDGKAAANYPEKPVNMIIAFTAGGSSDVQARIMQKYWNKYVPEQPWVFVYKSGAGGSIGFSEIAKSKPDGYTIGGVNVPHINLQPLGQGAQFGVDQFDYIAQVVNDPQVIVVKKGSQFKSVQEVIDYAKANPDKLKMGIVGTFTGHHLTLLDLQDKTGIKVAQVVYKGAADQNAALLGGELDVMIGNYNDVMRSLDQMTILGIATEEKYEALPDVPTLKELGVDVVSDIRRGFVAPKGIPEESLTFLRDTFEKICNDPDYIKDMEKAGQPHDYMSGADFEKFVMEENERAKELLTKYDLLKK
ncbi:tripartite tricarboxylate transporter substrate binding protein [Desulfotomaculum defluvii]